MTVLAQLMTLSECENVSVVYGEDEARVEALRDVDLTVRTGESLALWGRSGSGKTTILHVLGGLVEPTTGYVRWRGEPLSTLDAAARGRARARGIAYVFQGSNLLPHFTAYENVAFAHAAAEEAGSEEHGADPEELLGLVGLGSKLDSLPSELSGGEQQRVAIARALGQRPDLLLCDEPTGHLDSDTGLRVLDLVDALQERFGFALITATHDVDVAARADRMITLVDGRIVDQEEHTS
jgi:putative ABC transport system ATP-binding protein